MHHIAIIQKILTNSIHKKRLNTLKQMVDAAFRAKSLTVTQLGRGLLSNNSERSEIRKSDRFLSNKNLHKEYPIICKKVISYLTKGKSKINVLVDWSKTPNKDYHVIRASLVADGRALTLYEEVHDEKDLGKANIHSSFLKSFKDLLPDGCDPIIITDAGFGVPWFKQVLKLGWDYVGRVRGNKYYFIEEKQLKCCDLYNSSSNKARLVGRIKLTKKHNFETNMYSVKHIPKGRHSFTKKRNIRKDSNSKKQSKSATEALVVVSSLNDSPKDIIKVYQTRMQIEEGFRDLKSSKYGFGFEHMMSYKPMRILILLMIAMVDSIVAYLIGKIAEKLKINFQFQANSIRSKRVLSLFYLGRRIIIKFIQETTPHHNGKLIENIENEINNSEQYI